ncbi:hypothetical protein Dsin_011185 [Dipteronia sinensis]|uniref:Uncharacterized protein n=1 Tax=Dipteronia sinensis TaxID=43782 RepID=A0AAE0AUV6_9ROSI|nr:hypothetical protein Dsin_011185 [Dipteronia sinensis]
MFLRRKQSQNPQEIDYEQRDAKSEGMFHIWELGTGMLIRQRKRWKRLKWRATLKPEEIRWHEVAHEGETGKQVVKYLMDPKSFEKVRFVYTKSEDSEEYMRSIIDIENLPCEFSGKATLNYDHEEFSRLIAQDDVKTAKFWGFDDKPSYQVTKGHLEAAVAPVRAHLAPPVS